MKLTFLGKGGSGDGECPSLFAADTGTYVVVGWRTRTAGTVEIPHLLLGFAEPRTYLGAPMSDTGRGTFLVTGRPITDRETLDQMSMEPDETAIEIPKAERTFFGVTAAAQPVA
ncbi:hypothetical protein IU501_06385 [Nocardia otitidiscaviarum]|uniref:hypothetical protein n=1 Tax=Nocardia otitidiscaviarum TaxID=1823 RepID=UPI0004A6FBE4|nr:hypothetical protein [Nocardia otitidiscaviarum]MBF6132626.1 hypothetical protein [Nocardia otitidiscaviarum]MBF6239117.1 hypothetical protein [Nocardia otitidiscaviarum]MBF6488727.1 hypothetical protein [Nocardia otitidiscaviarum]